MNYRGIAMAAVIPDKVHFEPGSEALKVSAELSKEPSLIAASWYNLCSPEQTERLRSCACNSAVGRGKLRQG